MAPRCKEEKQQASLKDIFVRGEAQTGVRTSDGEAVGDREMKKTKKKKCLVVPNWFHQRVLTILRLSVK